MSHSGTAMTIHVQRAYVQVDSQMYSYFFFQAILMVLEDTAERTADRMTELLAEMYKINVITPNQLEQVGYIRIHKYLLNLI